MSVRDEVAELLGVSPAELDPQADLIASGLDSIRMMTLSGRWRRQGVDVGFAALAANPTVVAWTELVSGRDAPPAADPAPVATTGPGEGDTFPLAPIQHAMWIGRNEDQQLGGVAAHLYVEFDGAGVDPDRLRDAAAKLAARHPMLRVEILPDGTQRIGDWGLPVTVYDLRDLDLLAAAERLEGIRDEKSHQMMHGEVLQISLSLLADGRTRLHVDMDMQAADAVSYRNFMADLADFYSGVTLPELGYTYREYRAALTSTTVESDEDRRWWAERVPGLPEGPALPLVPRSEQADPKRARRRWHIFDVATRDALFAAAHRRGITPAMAVAASYAGTLARWSTNRRFLLNLPMFGREQFHPDVDKLVGDFTSSLMLDVDLSGADTPMARCRVLQETLHTTAQHSSYSGLSVLRDLTRHHGTPTLAPVVYTSALGLGDLFAGKVTEHFGRPVWTISQGPQVLLDAQATPVAEGLMINWDTREDAFRPGVADAMFAYHLAELERLATDESAWDAADPSAVTAQQQAARDVVNAVTRTPSGDVLHAGFFRNAEAYPDAPAVWCRDGDLTYGELREQVLAVAAALHVAGVRRADTVAVMGPKNFEQIVALLAISAIGAVYVPVGVDHPAERAARMLANGAVRMALVCGDRPPTTLPALTVAEALRVGRRETEFTLPAVDPADLAYILFTSGSTGEPKGVEMSHDAAMNTVEFINAHFDIGPADRCLALSTLECDLSVLDVFGMLGAGGSIVVVDEEHRRDPDVWARLVERHGVTVLHFMPGWLEMLSEVDGDLSSLRVVPTGGDWVRPEMVRALRKRAPHMRFAGLGGATETATHNTICEVEDIPAEWTSVPLGVPLPNNTCRVVGPDGRDCPDWVPGELWVGGRGVARGYCARPDLTAERFVEYDGRTWYRTGDLVRYRPGGVIEFVGRADHRIKISGYRVELGEVESALRRIPGVDSAVAAVVAADGGRDVLAALISGVADPQKVTTAMAEVVPPHMIPQIIVAADHIPYTLGGKIDRAAVTRMLADADLQCGTGYRAPATPLESALCDIIGTVLGRAAVGADDDFFASGGDSVLATQVVARVRTWLDTPAVAVADIFATRTAAALAARLSAGEPEGTRLAEVAELYLQVAGMDGAEVVSALESGR
ncbi:non-ribosomal peptide synthetase [Mycolicibacterium austroafricanum]|uniref:Phenyloxazoline synthase MbtB n=1 Tax=Mycolicibacterium austroafricanum TaxID=39687 RepID=A0ABT8HIF5_MYCAO|nr:non-ribosomal peptide synthetase [Mycolicibacterium austroafricanum]MDN4520555.1 non-ribosomal peptide synthetase [Mycolicibacterium austroafricanum]PQP43112.1 non-ribosomal peptide synthetase [Mycolicibacterium austroafricanum]QRZ04743.1 non-ribosomal peptide synthetase [Mycolicibacterium austroafricanum]QZT66586.1 non-ribosomal peptide synthetase [Mycolicibacterium austroafricanum]